MPQLALAALGSIVGESLLGAGAIGFLGLTGGGAGALAGSLIGSILFAPTQKSTAALIDLKAPKLEYGSVIPLAEGHPRLPAIIVWMSAKQPHANTQRAGKGGGAESTTFTYSCDILIVLCEGVSAGLRRVWNLGDLVFTAADDSDSDSVQASQAQELWTRMTFYSGAADQLPDPTYEAAVGTANAPAYRGRTSVFIEGLQLGTSGQLPNLTFEVVVGGDGPTGGEMTLEALFDTGNATDTSASGLTPTVGSDIVFVDNEVKIVASGASPHCQISWTGTELAKPADKPIVVELYTSWELLANSENNGVFDYFAASGQHFSIGYYSTGGLLKWRTNNGINDDVAIGYVAASTRTKVGIRIDIDGTATVRLDDAVGFTGATGWPSTAFTGSCLVEIGGGASPVNYRIDDLKLWIGEPYGTQGLDEPTLQEVVERQCQRGGLNLAYVDASALSTKKVHAYVLSQLTSPRQAIEVLMTAYNFVAVESDVLRFVFRGGASVATIGYDKLIADGNADPLPITKANDTELPVQVFVKYSNLFDDYQNGTEPSDRLISNGQNTTQVELPLAFTPTEAKQIADTQVLDAAASALRFGPFSLTRAYARLEPTDVVTLTDAEGGTHRARLTRKTEAAGVLTFEAVSDDDGVLASQAEADETGYTYSTAVRAPVDSEMELLDIPLLADADNDAGIYAVGRATDGGSWPGAALFKSADDITFTNVGSGAVVGTWGTASTTLGDGPTGVFDEANKLTVVVVGELESVTRDVLLSGASNMLLVGAEVIQFRTATLVSAGVYTLSGLLRGRRGTEWATADHVADERVVLLDSAATHVPMSSSETNQLRYWKAVTLGRTAATAASESFTNTGVNQKPFSPVNLRVVEDSGEIVVTWDRRSRLQCDIFTDTIPLGETSESYDIELLDNLGAVVGTDTVTVPQYTVGTAAAAFSLSPSVQMILDAGGDLVGSLDKYASQSVDGSLRRFDAGDGTYLGGMYIGGEITALTAVGSTLYVAAIDGTNDSKVRKLDKDALAVGAVPAFDASYTGPMDADCQGLAHDGTNLWVSLAYSGEIAKLNATTLVSAATYSVAAGIGAMVYAGGYLWICGRGTDEIIKVDPATGGIVSRFACTRFPIDVLVVGSIVFVAGAGTVASYTTGGVLLYSAPGGVSSAFRRAFANVGGEVIFADYTSGELVYLDETTGRETRRVAVASLYCVVGGTSSTYFAATRGSGTLLNVHSYGANAAVSGGSLRVYQLSEAVGRGYPAEVDL